MIETARRPDEELRLVYAGFWLRAVAMLIDLWIVGRLIALGPGRLYRRLLPDPEVLGVARVSTLLVAGLFLLYLTLATAWFGRTLGKHFLRLRVVTTDVGRPDLGTAFFREVVGRILSTLVLFLGYLWAATDPRKQGWHDKVADTFVIRRVTLLAGPDPWEEAPVEVPTPPPPIESRTA